jgi:D-threo-aldose 1-dehydrogenase
MMEYSKIGKTELLMPPIIFGTSALGNLYRSIDDPTKYAIVEECFRHVRNPVFDSAGKYGAGLSLEMLGKCLQKLNIPPDKVVISNKLGWLCTKLNTPEPTFEKGVWFGLKNDAVQKISYEGIIACFNQGNELLGGRYKPQLVSVHDPDEYLNMAKSPEEKQQLFSDILEAYRALDDLKRSGEVKAVGIGSKDWTVIKEVARHVSLDWVMLANSLTIMNHPSGLLAFIDEMVKKGTTVINSAVFHGGFLTGSDYYDYKLVTPTTDPLKFQWRTSFNTLCAKYNISPMAACVNFGMSHPGVSAISLNTSNPERIKDNVESVCKKVPVEFYAEMVQAGLISKDYPYVGH